MEKNDIPKAWREALSAIQRLFPMAVMAGGCLRDRDQGVKVKDIDIFMPTDTSTAKDLMLVGKALRDDGWEITVSASKMYPTGCDTRVIGIIDTVYPGCPPIQIIVGDWNMSHLFDHFDFGICQISFDGRQLRWSKDYMRDKIGRIFRLVTERSDLAFVSSINRWARLKEKYPDWTFHLGTRGVEGVLSTGRMVFRGPNMQQVRKT